MNSAETSTIRKPFIDHVRELQVRLTWIVVFLALTSIVAYNFHQKLLDLIQQPLGQTLYYTSPTGGFSFLFKLCLTIGFVLALPVITYHLFKFMSPLIQHFNRATIVAYLVWSFDLALAGVMFAYFISLPAALHFLAKFGGDTIQSIITADEYFSFALAYIAGFALLFQLPLLVILMNRIKPMTPLKMMSYQRYVILFSFILAAILTPTPDPFNQALMALPIVVLYQFSIVIIMFVNRKRRSKKTPRSKNYAGEEAANAELDSINQSKTKDILGLPIERQTITTNLDKAIAVNRPTTTTKQPPAPQRFSDVIIPTTD